MLKVINYCLVGILLSASLIFFGYDLSDNESRSLSLDKIVYETGGYCDADLSLEGNVDINNQKVVLMVMLEYDRDPINMVEGLDPMSMNSYMYHSYYKKDYQEYHTRMNNELVETLNIGDYQSMYISTLTPFIEYTYVQWQFDMNKEEILKNLNANSNVKKVYVQYLTNSVGYVDTLLDGTGMAGAANDVIYRNYTGDGVVVGLLENGIIDTSHQNFVGVDVTIHDQSGFTETASEHTTKVASIIGGIDGVACDVAFLTSQINGGICEEVDWLIENGADIINMSFSNLNKDGVYGSTSAYVDYTARVYSQIFVASSGNTNGTSNYYVDDPGLAFNAITVGAIDTDFYWRDFSCYMTATGSAVKPTVMAKGFSIGIPNISGVDSGTSLSCAFVSGLCALILERYPSLTNNPMKLISLITTNATRTLDDYYYDEDNGFDEKMGSGEFSYINICDNIIYYESIPYSTSETNTVVHRHEFVLDEGETVQASIAWFSYADEDDTTTAARTNYDIRLMYNGVVYSAGSTTYNNIEMVNFTAPADNSECAIIILQHSAQVLTTETICYSYRIFTES
ncbi:MAG: S8 family serine peptidase [Bacilli bacterium]|nr:S8 family serine peptidase [Bacilli bacterium]